MTALDDAIRHAKAATITPEAWMLRIRYGQASGKPYAYTNTHMWKALTALYAAAHPPVVKPAPAPVPQPVNPLAAYVVFCAEDPGHAINAPAKYTIAYSADPEYRYPTEKRPDLDLHAIIADAQRRGHRTAGWCDCRSSGGTPAKVGAEFVHDYGLDYFIGQAESEAEMKDALSVGAKVVVGNITAAGVAQHIGPDVAFIQEDYWNEGWARANDPRIAAYCAGVYPALWAPNIAAYRQAGRWRDGDGIYYARPDTDWQNLP